MEQVLSQKFSQNGTKSIETGAKRVLGAYFLVLREPIGTYRDPLEARVATRGQKHTLNCQFTYYFWV